MSKTIIGKFFSINDDDLEDTIDYLKQLGMTFGNGIEKNLFYIELKQLPEILFKLEQRGYLEIYSREAWDIRKISVEGVVLYIVEEYGDGYIFLPKENIVSIHTIEEEFLDAIAQKNQLRKIKATYFDKQVEIDT
ncbi:hypothetical protein [Nostoc sp. CHAB 5715]|uniref:hypothetical protein n=1 Tax=Nostoc sp. CHAB 5715 TaxID=2780400 RepID=UPI001E3796CB|nr:hypothetical protein [Nostoc sp. CHAB 5715]MCC5620574.1 hypothetical protein [Nostoc sp. CHAB 5715]